MPYSNKPPNSLLMLLMTFCLATVMQCSSIQLTLTQGSNLYSDLNHTFSTLQTVSVTDMHSEADQSIYRFCFINQYQSSFFKKTRTMRLFESLTENNKQQASVLFDIDELLKMDTIVDDFYDYESQVLYVLTTKELKVGKVGDKGKVDILKGVRLQGEVDSGDVVKVGQGVIVRVKSGLFAVGEDDTGNVRLRRISIEIQPQQTLSSVISVQRKPLIASSLSLRLYNPFSQQQQLDSTRPLPLIQKRLLNLPYDPFRQFFIFSTSSNQTILFSLDTAGLSFNPHIDLQTNLSIFSQHFTLVPHTQKCNMLRFFQEYVVVSCMNHLRYVEVKQLLKCGEQATSQQNQTSQCLNSIKWQHVNIGYHINDVNIQDDIIIVSGIDRFTILYIETVQLSDQTLTLIKNVMHSHTHQCNQTLISAILVSTNQLILVTRSSLVMGIVIPPQNEIFCRTVDQNSQKMLGQPEGTFNGKIKYQGLCEDVISTVDVDTIMQKEAGSNICSVQVPVKVYIVPELKRYETAWYVVVAALVGVIVAIIVYGYIKYRKVSAQYQLFQDEHLHGQQVLQQTMVTETNQDNNPQVLEEH